MSLANTQTLDRLNLGPIAEKLRQTMANRLKAAAIFLQGKVRELISIPSRTVEIGQYTKGPRKGQEKKILGPRGSSRSKPGESPHKDHGTLRSSIAVEVNKSAMTAHVGSALKYARFLELGTAGGRVIRPVNKKALKFEVGGVTVFRKKVVMKPLAPRPFLRRALAENKAAILQIMATGQVPGGAA